MPYLAVQLNHMTNALARVLPPTDPRRRLDIRALEAGKFEEACRSPSQNLPDRRYLALLSSQKTASNLKYRFTSH